MLDVSRLASDPHFARCFVVRRPTGGFEGSGTFQADYQSFEARGSVQPATQAQIDSLPGGEGFTDVIAVWTADDVRCGDGQAETSDTIVVDGRAYRVIKIENWRQSGYVLVFAEGFGPA